VSHVEVLKQDYHRNGVGGAGFVVSLVRWPEATAGRPEAQTFVAVSFFKDDDEDDHEYLRAHTSVLCVEGLAAGAIDMHDPEFPNAWRGADYVGPAVVEAWYSRPDPFAELLAE
jgi:hypothetical protein